MAVTAGLLATAVPAAALLGAVLFALAARELVYRGLRHLVGDPA